MLSLEPPYKLFCPPQLEKGILENGEENHILLVIGHPASVFAIPIDELKENLDRIPLDKNRRAYFVENKEDQFFIKMEEKEHFPIDEFLIGKCSIPQVDHKSSKEGLGHPFDKMFNDLDEANEVLDLFSKSILWLQDDEQERQRQLVLSVDKKGRMTLNFGQWAVLSYDCTIGWALALKTQTMKGILNKDCSSFAEKIDGVEYTALRINDLDFHPNQVIEEYEETVRKIGEKFGDWKGTPFNKAHQAIAYEAAMFPEKRE